MPREQTGHLFGDPDEVQTPDPSAPLADRMRPLSLEEFVGQEHLIGAGRVLRRLIEGGGALPSLILGGAPGTGKTTLARLLASRGGARFVPLSAVLSGVRDVRDAIAEARQARRRGARTVLFIDEIHRCNRAQQDALLRSEARDHCPGPGGRVCRVHRDIHRSPIAPLLRRDAASTKSEQEVLSERSPGYDRLSPRDVSGGMHSS